MDRGATTPVPRAIVERHLATMGIVDMSKATIRELSRLANEVERESGVEFIHMEMGVPGLPPSTIGIEAEIAALRGGCAPNSKSTLRPAARAQYSTPTPTTRRGCA